MRMGQRLRGVLVAAATAAGGYYVSSSARQMLVAAQNSSAEQQETRASSAVEREDEAPRVLPEEHELRHRWNCAIDTAFGHLTTFLAKRGL